MKLPTTGVSKIFGKTQYRDFTLEDFQKLFTEFDMTFFACDKIAHSLVYFDKDSEIYHYVSSQLLSWLKIKYFQDLVPHSNDINSWKLLAQNSEINSNNLFYNVLAEQFKTSKLRNKLSKRDKADLVNKEKYHFEQGGSFGKK